MMMTMAQSRPSAPTTPARGPTPASTCHAVSRSAELLSCARTSLRLAQERRKKAAAEGSEVSHDDLPEFLRELPPGSLTLFVEGAAEESAARASTCDAIQLLSALDSSVSDLGALVRRRGHTNDPTAEINACCQSFQTYAKELAETAQQIRTAGTVPIDGRRSSAMRQRHYEHVADQIKKAGEKRVAKFKKVLEVRGEVIKDQNRRRRMLNPSANKAGAGGAAAASARPAKVAAPGSGNFSSGRGGMSQLESPLFTMTGTGGSLPKAPAARRRPAPPVASAEAGSAGTNGSKTASSVAPPPARQHSAYAAPPAPALFGGASSSAHSAPSSMNANGSAASNASAAYPMQSAAYSASSSSGFGGSYGAYGGGYGGYGGGYGGYGAESDTGMRRRPNAAPSSVQGAQQAYPYRPENDPSPDADANTAEDMAAQIQARKAKRETQTRLEEARQAESKLAELTGLFGRMADLVVVQGETLTKIEDDVEAAHGDVTAGQEEIVKLHGITKGNRALILKVFAILIFFIVFMRFY